MMRDRTRSAKVFVGATALGMAALLIAGCGGAGEDASIPHTGREIYVASCQTCHGRAGEGFVGPSLIDVASRYPEIATQIALVTNGVGEMPGWRGRLTTRQIETVVEFTRTEFTSTPSTTVPFQGPTR